MYRDNFYKKKYIKYKIKYLKMIGGLTSAEYKLYKTAIDTYYKIQENFVCNKNGLEIINTSPLSVSGGIHGHGGAFLYNGIINTPERGHIQVVLKLFSVPDNIMRRSQNPLVNDEPIIKDKNEIGITHYISDNMLESGQTDIFTMVYKTFLCDNSMLNYINEINRLSINKDIRSYQHEPTTYTTIMVVEKVKGDLRSEIITGIRDMFDNYLDGQDELITNKLKYMEDKILSILMRVAYGYIKFNEIFEGFYHGDLHCGNILLSLDDRLQEVNYEHNFEDEILKIECKTFGIHPKLWDFQTSYVKKLNDEIKKQPNDGKIITKYFDYLLNMGMVPSATEGINMVAAERKDVNDLITSIIMSYNVIPNDIQKRKLEANPAKQNEFTELLKLKSQIYTEFATYIGSDMTMARLLTRIGFMLPENVGRIV